MEPQALPPESPELPKNSRLATRILAHLWRAELSESNPHFQTDYRIAWITVLFASRGDPAPHAAATYTVLGLHPSKVWSAILARRRAQLGRDYSLFYDAEGNWKPEPIADPWQGESPRKPVQSVRLLAPDTGEAA